MTLPRQSGYAPGYAHVAPGTEWEREWRGKRITLKVSYVLDTPEGDGGPCAHCVIVGTRYMRWVPIRTLLRHYTEVHR